MVPISFRWDPVFVARIDAARGDVPRTVFVQRAVEGVLELGVGPAGVSRAEPVPDDGPGLADQEVPSGDGRADRFRGMTARRRA